VLWETQRAFFGVSKECEPFIGIKKTIWGDFKSKRQKSSLTNLLNKQNRVIIRRNQGFIRDNWDFNRRRLAWSWCFFRLKPRIARRIRTHRSIISRVRRKIPRLKGINPQSREIARENPRHRDFWQVQAKERLPEPFTKRKGNRGAESGEVCGNGTDVFELIR
jgi:hypothetical protein